MAPLRIALQFLTRLPIASDVPEPREVGRSLAWYPVVGALLGLALLLAGAVMPSPAAGAGLALMAWVALTGALHLDGLGDLADAWVGGQGDPDRTLGIMKDAYAGPMAVSAIGAVLIAKYAALTALFQSGALPVVLLAPVLGRAAVPALLLSTRYVRPGGLGSDLAEHAPRRSLRWVLGAVAVAAVSLMGWHGIIALLAAALAGWAVREACRRRIGGVTGDCLGAAIELVEVAVLYAALL